MNLKSAEQRQTAIMVGAGNIGRGFIGQLLFEWGFHTIFVDVNTRIVEAINQYHEYPITFVSEEADEIYTVREVSAINGRNTDEVADAISNASLMAVSVGARALPSIIPALARGITLRSERNAPPLNILLCENLFEVSQYVRALLLERLDEKESAYLNTHIGLVETSIGRMIPVQTEREDGSHPLSIRAESYCRLPVDRDAFVGDVPQFPYLKPYSPFGFYISRKLYIHNMGHAGAAYLGNMRGYTHIWQAMQDVEIRRVVKQAMLESAAAIAKKYNENESELEAHADDLLHRFANRKLGDTVQRVGADLPRKLGKNDRLFGAARLCMEQGIEPNAILRCIRAAFVFEEKALSYTQLFGMAKILVGE